MWLWYQQKIGDIRTKCWIPLALTALEGKGFWKHPIIVPIMQVCIKNSKYKPFYLCCGLRTWRKEFILLILCEIFNWSFCINWEQSLNWILLCEISSAWKVFPTEWTIPFLNSFIYYVVHRIYIFSPFSNIKITFPIDRHQKLAQDSFSKAIHYSYNSTDPK